MKERRNELELFGLLGTPGFDCLFYLGAFLTAMGKKVFLFDGTRERELAGCIPDTEHGPVHMDGMDIGCALPEGGYDLTLLLLPFEALEEGGLAGRFPSVSGWYAVGDCRRRNVEWLRACLTAIPDLKMILLRDIPPGKLSGGCLERLYFDRKGPDCRVFPLPLDGEDYSRRIRLEYEPVHRPGRLSPEFRALLKELAKEITGFDRKRIRKSFGRWERRRKP